MEISSLVNSPLLSYCFYTVGERWGGIGETSRLRIMTSEMSFVSNISEDNGQCATLLWQLSHCPRTLLTFTQKKNSIFHAASWLSLLSSRCSASWLTSGGANFEAAVEMSELNLHVQLGQPPQQGLGTCKLLSGNYSLLIIMTQANWNPYVAGGFTKHLRHRNNTRGTKCSPQECN